MQSEKLKDLKRLYRKIVQFDKKLDAQVRELREMQRVYCELAASCDHKHANGHSAVRKLCCECCDECVDVRMVCSICQQCVDTPIEPVYAELAEIPWLREAAGLSSLDATDDSSGFAE